jgi:hypothetical protein
MEDKEFRRVVLSAVLGTLAGFITTQLCEKYLFREVCECSCCKSGIKCACGENQYNAKFVQTPNSSASK